MIVPALGRHLYVCALREVQPILDRDKAFWHIVSIRTPMSPPAARFRWALDVLPLVFDDIETAGTPEAEGLRPVQVEDLKKVFAFLDERPGKPMLIHCRAGVSRSTGLALLLIARGMIQRGDPDVTTAAVDQLLALRPHAVPNCRILELGLAQCMPADRAREVMVTMSNHPQLIQNRFINPNRE